MAHKKWDYTNHKHNFRLQILIKPKNWPMAQGVGERWQKLNLNPH